MYDYPDGRSPWGLYQMAGNVMEWCEDWSTWQDSYRRGILKPDISGTERVQRGGSWSLDDPKRFRCFSGTQDPPTNESSKIGFRVARDAGDVARGLTAGLPSGAAVSPQTSAKAEVQMPPSAQPASTTLAVASQSLPHPSAKLPIPSDTALAPAVKLAGEMFKAEYDKAQSSAALTALAKSIMQKAAEIQSDAPARFVFLRLARDVASKAGRQPNGN